MVIISPFARQMRNGEPHPKVYPYWKQLVPMIIDKVDSNIIQVGIEGEEQLVPDFRKNLSLQQLGELIDQCDTWVSIDSFFQHYCWDRGKPGVVIWGQSDPVIFGHKENINLLKDRKYLRDKQFWWWEQTHLIPESFVDPSVVLDAIIQSRALNRKS